MCIAGLRFVTPLLNEDWLIDFYRHRHVILQGRNKFCLNWTITEKVTTLCRFFKMAAIPWQISFCFLVLWHLAFRKAKNYLRIKFRPDTRYLNPRPSYYYFWLLKTNIRHIWILLPVSTNSSPSSACDSALAYKILCKSDDRRRSYDAILILQDGGRSVANLLPVSGLATSGYLRRSNAIGMPNVHSLQINNVSLQSS